MADITAPITEEKEPQILTDYELRELAYYKLLETDLSLQQRQTFSKMRIEIAHTLRELFYHL
jgi:hypothetical protein